MKSVNGMKLVMSRAPMTTPSVMKVRVIDDNHPWADVIEADAIYQSPLAMVKDAGDNDGDNRTFTRADDSNLTVTTVKEVIENVVERTGSDQLVPGASYWGDHYNIPSAKSVAKKRQVGRKNFSLNSDNTDLKSESARQSLAGMLEGSTQMFQESVGWVHRLFLTTDLYLSLVWTLEETLKETFCNWSAHEWTKNKSLVLILAEIYEVPLGGLSWEAYDVIFDTLIPVIRDGLQLQNDTISKFGEQLNAAGMNGAHAEHIYKAAKTTNECRGISKEGISDSKEFYQSPELFLKLTAELAALIGKGQLDPRRNDIHKECITQWIEWIEACGVKEVLVEKSITLRQIYEYATVMFPAQMGNVAEVDLSFFDFD
jgi:hypothetical protein